MNKIQRSAYIRKDYEFCERAEAAGVVDMSSTWRCRTAYHVAGVERSITAEADHDAGVNGR